MKALTDQKAVSSGRNEIGLGLKAPNPRTAKITAISEVFTSLVNLAVNSIHRRQTPRRVSPRLVGFITPRSGVQVSPEPL